MMGPEGENMARYQRLGGALLGAILLLAVAPALAAEDEANAPKVPRFVSLDADKVNLRTGPGQRYPIDWVLTRRDMPVEVIAQFENWRRIRQWDGTTGWVQQNLLTGKRHAIVAKGDVRPVHRQPDPASALVARAEPGVISRLTECREAWCRIETPSVSGWMRRADLWGVYPDEKVP
jgi:SH3-like domain-containing protein